MVKALAPRARRRGADRALHAVFGESQIFRIDHFLGKEGYSGDRNVM